MIDSVANLQQIDPSPAATNDFLASHVELLTRSLFDLTGRSLVDPDLSSTAAARRIYHAPFVVLSHNSEPDPVLTYANRSALQLFEMDWDTLIRTPSRLTAEAPLREERERLLARVSERGYIDDYSGIRISRSGRRFRIEQATVWNLKDVTGVYRGQAAVFSHWVFL